MSEYFNNIVYGIKSFVTGLGLTLKHFRNKKNLVATLQYPNEKWPQPERNIGFDLSEYNQIRSRLHVDIDDCIGCLQCERACPVDCIKIDTIKPPKGSDYDCGMTSNDTQKKMIVPRFTIDMSECMYCNLCVYPCPEECIYMVGGPNEEKHEMDYEFSQYERHGLVYEFATSTDQDILDIGGEAYLKEKKEKELKRNAGKKLEGIVETEGDDSSKSQESDKKKHKDPLLELFNIVSDKVLRGIAKKAVVFCKRNKYDSNKMAEEVSKRIQSSSRTSDKMNEAIESLRNYVPEEEVVIESKQDDSSKTKTAASVENVDSNFSVKSLDFIEDKMIRGVAKKSFMAGKRAGLDSNGKIDKIIENLESSGKINDEIKNQLQSLKSTGIADDSSSNQDAKIQNENIEVDILFDIKLLNEIEDKMVRGSSKKIYMAGKRASKNSSEVINDILKELADKLDDKTKLYIEGLK